MARSSWNFTLRKPKHRGVQTIVNLDESIYSTLSKKPADLETTDIDLSAIRIFLGDGSHRTIGCTPTTTCGELLDQILSKLGLVEQQEEYGLQIKYKYAELRIAEDSEIVSELNSGVMDSIERVYLCKKAADPDVLVYRKKRLASFDGLQEDIYENRTIITSQLLAAEDEKSDMQPVLVNDKIVSGFAKAWNRGSQLQECGSPGGQQSISLGFNQIGTRPVSPQNNYSSYTMERKKSNLKRSAPVSPAAARSLKIRNLSETDIRKYSVSPSPRHSTNHFLIPTSPDIGGTMEHYKQRMSQTGKCNSEEKLSTPCGHKRVEKQRKLMKKSQSVECLVSECTNERKTNLTKSSSIQILNLRDSGIDDNCSQCSVAETLPSYPAMVPVAQLLRRKSLSHNSLPSPGPTSIKVSPVSQSVPVLATHPVKASTNIETRVTTPTYNRMTTRSCSNIHAASLQSYKSMELLTGDDLEEIHATLTVNIAKESVSPGPPIPKRTSSTLENCTISDEYLLNQGKRLSQILNFSPTKKEHKGPIKSLFKKVGTLLKKNKDSTSSPSSSPMMPRRHSSSAKSRFRLELPSPIADGTEVRSLGGQWSDAEYDKPNIRSPSQLSLQKQPSQSSLLSPQSNLGEPNRHNQRTFDEKKKQEVYDIAVPTQIPPRNQEYLEIISSATKPSVKENLYENYCMDQMEEDFYLSPPPHGYNVPSKQDSEDELDYENKPIECGANNSITFNGSQLHDYQLPNSVSQTAVPSTPSTIYENSEIRTTSKNGIALGKEELHVYDVPKPLPPPLPPKAASSLSSDIPAPPLPPKHTQTTEKYINNDNSNSKPNSLHLGQPMISDKQLVQSSASSKPTSETDIPNVSDIIKQMNTGSECSITRSRLTSVHRKSGRVHTYPVLQRKRKPSTLSDIYYEDITDWIPNSETSDTLSVPQQLQATISEPNLSCNSQIYDTIPDDVIDEPEDEYIPMKGGISVRNGIIKTQRSSSNVTEIGHVALLQQIMSNKQMLGVQQQAARKPLKKLPLPLPKPGKHSRFPSPAGPPSKQSPARPNCSSTPIAPPAPPPPPIATLPKWTSEAKIHNTSCSKQTSPIPSAPPAKSNTFPSVPIVPPAPPPPPPPVSNITQQTAHTPPILPPKPFSFPSPPVPPPPPALSMLPNPKQKPVLTPPVPPQKPARPQTLALPVPLPPPPPSPIYAVPNVAKKSTHISPTPPQKLGSIPSFPTPPPPPPLSTIPKRSPNNSAASLPSPFTPNVTVPPPPAPSPVVTLTAATLKSVVLKKHSPVSEKTVSKTNSLSPRNQAPGALFSEELFARIKSISKRFDTENSEKNIYGNTT